MDPDLLYDDRPLKTLFFQPMPKNLMITKLRMDIIAIPASPEYRKAKPVFFICLKLISVPTEAMTIRIKKWVIGLIIVTRVFGNKPKELRIAISKKPSTNQGKTSPVADFGFSLTAPFVTVFPGEKQADKKDYRHNENSPSQFNNGCNFPGFLAESKTSSHYRRNILHRHADPSAIGEIG